MWSSARSGKPSPTESCADFGASAKEQDSTRRKRRRERGGRARVGKVDENGPRENNKGCRAQREKAPFLIRSLQLRRRKTRTG